MITVTYYVGIEDKGKNMISTINFRNNVNRFWTDYIDWVEDYTSLTGTGQDSSDLYWQIIRYLSVFYNEVRSVYGRTAAEDVTKCIAAMFEGLTQAKILIENDIDPAPVTERVATEVIGKLATTLAGLNPEWKPEVVTPLFVNMWQAWLDHCRATLANNIEDADAAETKAMLSALAFSDAFINGAIKQYSPIFF